MSTLSYEECSTFDVEKLHRTFIKETQQGIILRLETTEPHTAEETTDRMCDLFSVATNDFPDSVHIGENYTLLKAPEESGSDEIITALQFTVPRGTNLVTSGYYHW